MTLLDYPPFRVPQYHPPPLFYVMMSFIYRIFSQRPIKQLQGTEFRLKGPWNCNRICCKHRGCTKKTRVEEYIYHTIAKAYHKSRNCLKKGTLFSSNFTHVAFFETPCISGSTSSQHTKKDPVGVVDDVTKLYSDISGL